MVAPPEQLEPVPAPSALLLAGSGAAIRGIFVLLFFLCSHTSPSSSMAQARPRTQQGQLDADAKSDAQNARDPASPPEQSVLAAVPRRLFRFIGWLVLREEEEWWLRPRPSIRCRRGPRLLLLWRLALGHPRACPV
jgi:hypothetical protein